MGRTQLIFFIIIVFAVYSLIDGETSQKKEHESGFYSLIDGEASQKKEPESKESIIDADNYSKELILSALNNTDKNIIKYILSINVVTQRAVASVCNEYVPENKWNLREISQEIKTQGCTSSVFDENEKLIKSNIYLSEMNAYKGNCGTFNNTLYHEIGHVVYAYKFGRDAYQNEEEYAENYADNHSKNKCNTDIFKELERRLKEKEDAYNNSLKILTKWDKYSDIIKSTSYGYTVRKVCSRHSSPDELNCGIPINLYDEYLHDYNQYSNSVDEYNSVLREIDNYLNSTDNGKDLEITNDSLETRRKIKWEFGCIQHCSEDSGPSESDGLFSIENIGSLTFHKLKLVIEYYRESGTFYNSRSSENFIQVLNASDYGIFRIKIPFRYANEETWSYAKIYILQNNTRHQLVSEWRGEVINGTWEQ